MAALKDGDDVALHIGETFEAYYPVLAAQLSQKLPQIRFEASEFGNLMPLLVAGEVSHAVMLWLLNGDNWQTALIDLYLAHVFTQDIDAAGPNVAELTLFVPFVDSRMDTRGRKVVPGDPAGNLAIIKGQASFTEALANLMKFVAGVKNFVNIDGHSSEFAHKLEQVGIEVINITSAFVLIEELIARGLMDDSFENVICGVDFGNLALTQKISQRLKLKLAIIRKTREPTIRGEDSETKHTLVYGDVKGKRVILMDDMISSGGTIIETVNLLLAAGAKEILVCAAHAVFAARDYYKTMVKLLKIPEVKIVMTTDTLPLKRPGFAQSRSLPYAILPGVAGADGMEPAEVTKQVEMLPLDGFIGQIVQALMTTHNAAEIRAILAEHIVKQRDPYDIYQEITGVRLVKPKSIAIYREGGRYEPLPATAQD